jgi:PAS domain-containing protein
MVVAGTLSFKGLNKEIGQLPSIMGIDPYAIFIGLVYLILSIGIMEYFVLFRIRHFNEDIKAIKEEGFAGKCKIYNFSKQDELGEIIEDVNTVLCELDNQSQKLQTKTKLYLGLVNDESIYAYRFLPDGTVTFANKAFSDIFKYHYKNMLGKDIYEFFDTLGFNSDQLRRTIALLNPSSSSSSMIYDIPLILNEKIPKWIAWTASAAFDERGLIKEYQVVGINMHKVPSLSNEKRRVEDRQSTILLNPEGKIDYMFSSIDFSDVIGEDFIDFVHAHDQSIVTKSIRRLITNHQKSVVNVRVKFKEEFLLVQMSVDCSIGKDDKLKNIVINAIDMTEIQGAQEKVVGAVNNMHKILEEQNF